MHAIHYSHQSISKRDIDSTLRALTRDYLTQGPTVHQFELQIAKFCNVPFSVAVNSGTAALHTALFAVGLRPGDEVVTSPLSFAASANAIVYLGGIPVFADIDYETGLLDPILVEKKITKKTRAILTVDYAGNPSYFHKLREIAHRHRLYLIDDASHSFGARYHGDPIGGQADITTFSFHPVKTITTGEGGAIVTGDERMYRRALLFRTHGITKERSRFLYPEHKDEPWYYEMQELGMNYRLTDIQCALGLSQLSKVELFLRKRRKIAYYYTESLKSLKAIKPYNERKDCQSSWHLYPSRIVQPIDKIALFRRLKRKRIIPQVHYIPIHLHPYYRTRYGYKEGDFPKAELFYRQEVSIPLFYDLTLQSAHSVIREFIKAVTALL